MATVQLGRCRSRSTVWFPRPGWSPVWRRGRWLRGAAVLVADDTRLAQIWALLGPIWVGAGRLPRAMAVLPGVKVV
jgi:hypothetical protein